MTLSPESLTVCSTGQTIYSYLFNELHRGTIQQALEKTIVILVLISLQKEEVIKSSKKKSSSNLNFISKHTMLTKIILSLIFES